MCMQDRFGSLVRVFRQHVVVGISLGIWIVAHLLPRDEHRWVFSALDGDAFEGNPKYLYLYAARQDGVDAVWIGNAAIVDSLRAAGYRAYRRDSLRGRYAVLRSGVVFGSHYIDVPWAYTGGAIIVQLWHGNGIKRVGRHAGRDYFSPLSRLLPELVLWNWDYVVTTAPGEPAARMVDCFSVTSQQVLSTGYPRTDLLFRQISDYNIAPETDVYDEIEALAEERTVVSYIPTFRKNYGNTQGRSVAESGVDFGRLNRLCAAEDAELLVKFHPQEEYDPGIDAYDHVRVLPQELDLMPIMNSTDVLVTDYSSAYMDFLLLDRPIVFYAYDRAEYVESKGFYFAYDDVTPGPVVETEPALYEALGRILQGTDDYRESRRELRERFHSYVDGQASERVFEAVMAEVGD